MMTAPKLAQVKVSSQTKLIILTFFFIAFGFPRAIVVIEPISMSLLNAIFDFVWRATIASIVRKKYREFAK